MIAAAFLASGIAILGLASVLVQVGATRARRAHELGERESER